MPLIANAQGEVEGKFTVPGGIPSGSKLIRVHGQNGNKGEAVYVGQGAAERQKHDQHRNNNHHGKRWKSPPKPRKRAADGTDPIAQTFTLENTTQVTGLDLWFAVAPTSRTQVQLRDTANGLPGSEIIAEAVLDVGSVVVAGGAPTNIAFAGPVVLYGGTEYAIVVLCEDATGALAIAELGKFDATAQRWITSQPYTVGMMLSSANGITWTAHQDRDMVFRILAAQYSQTTKTVALGKVAVVAASDLMVMSYADNPSSATNIEYLLTLPDATVLTVSDGQPVQLAAPITGDVLISARLTGDGDFAPVLEPGTQLAVGSVGATGTYVTRAIPAGANVTVKVIFEALVPNGANVIVSYMGIDAGDVWTVIAAPTQSAADDGFTEFVYTKANVTEGAVRIKVELTGTAAARPRLRDFRALVM
jgi:hypothetical protein